MQLATGKWRQPSCGALKFVSVRSFARSRYVPAIAAGLLLAAAFPGIDIAGFAWIAPGLLLTCALGQRPGETFRIGYVGGLAYNLLLLHWLLHIPVTGFPILGWVALSAYLAVYPALWVWLCWKVSGITNHVSGSNSQTPKLSNSETFPLTLNSELSAISSWPWTRRVHWALVCAALWVALEMIVSRLFGGFPWNLLGASQYRALPLIQLASITGVSGLSFLVAWTSLSLLCSVAVIINRPNLRSVWMGEIILPFTAVAAAFVFGFAHMRETPAVSARGLDVTLVQPSIPQTLIWDSSTADQRFQDLLRLTEIALSNRTDLLIWPEAAVPKLLRYDETTFAAVTNIAVKHHVWMIVGSDDAEPSKHSSDPKDADYFNSSFLVSPEGRLAAHYQKRQLVIFGEYIPLVRWLPFIKWFTPIQGSFTEGDRSRPFEFSIPSDEAFVNASDQSVKTSVLICYEDTFASLARKDTTPNTDFLVNITNDGWFGEGAEQWQQAATALFRTVENGLPLIRCTNNGLTCWYDANGRLREFLTDARGTIYGPGYMTVRIPLLAAGQRRVPTFYQQYGDWFGWSCLGYAVLALFRARRFKSLEV